MLYQHTSPQPGRDPTEWLDPDLWSQTDVGPWGQATPPDPMDPDPNDITWATLFGLEQ